MQVPLELSFHTLPEHEEDTARALVESEVQRLDRLADLIACRVAVEQPQQHQRPGNPYRVRIRVTIPPGKELIVTQEPSHRRQHESLQRTIRHAFRAMERQIKAASARRRGDVKHAEAHDEPHGIVVRRFPGAHYGFIKDLESEEEIYFHANAVLGHGFERLEEGTLVRYTPAMGDEGPQASTVHISDKPGVASARQGEPEVHAPPGWTRRDGR